MARSAGSYIEMRQRRYNFFPQSFQWQGRIFHVQQVERSWSKMSGWFSRRRARRLCFRVRTLALPAPGRFGSQAPRADAWRSIRTCWPTPGTWGGFWPERHSQLQHCPGKAGWEAIPTMISGLLWFDDDPRKDTGRKIGEAAQRYLLRFGVAPTVCRVHCPAQASGPGAPAPTLSFTTPSRRAPLTVVPDRRVRPHHFWLGQAETDPAGTGAADTARTVQD